MSGFANAITRERSQHVMKLTEQRQTDRPGTWCCPVLNFLSPKFNSHNQKLADYRSLMALLELTLCSCSSRDSNLDLIEPFVWLQRL